MKRIAYILNTTNEFELVKMPSKANSKYFIIDQHRINESEIARAVKCSHQYIQKIIAGKVKAPLMRVAIEYFLNPKKKTDSAPIGIYVTYKHNKTATK